MLKQMYYSARDGMFVRAISFGIMMGINLFFLPFALRHPGGVMSILAIVFSSLALGHIIIANGIISFSGLSEVFSAPGGYSLLLTPLPAWKILLGKIIPAAVIDVAGGAIGIMWVVWYSLSFTGLSRTFVQFVSVRDLLFVIGASFGGYLLLLTMFCFFRTLSRSVFYRLPLRGLLSIIVTFAVAGTINSWWGLLLAPFGTLEWIGPFLTIMLYTTLLNQLMVVLVVLLQACTLFLASAYLTERKINI